jgi:2-polyprenyl-3-methyl-5-hydroxy-6-metoxy-1,4-benzoquinol methylase
MEEILSWPVEWSALHGIAEIKTPILKVSTRSDIAHGKRVVRWHGSAYPAEGARGLSFPYVKPRSLAVTASASFRRGMAHSLQSAAPTERPAWYHEDNGFSKREAMDWAHAPLVAMARTALRSGAVLDLGCGNGALLAKICAGLPDVAAHGVDRSGAVIQHARQLLPNFAGNFRVADLFDVASWSEGRSYALVILMVGRLLEVPDDPRQRVVESLRHSTTTVLLYKYPGWSSEDLAKLIENAGLGPIASRAGDCALVTIRAAPAVAP